MTDTDSDLLNLHRQIVLRPHDLDIRAVYADRLEDLGNHDRAELIRVQCEFPAASLRSTHTVCHHDKPAYGCCCRCEWCGLRERSRQLLHAPAPGLWNPNPGNGYVWSGAALHNAGLHISWKYHNGFPDHITCDCWTWERHGPKIVASVPVVRVELSDREPLQSRDGRWYWLCGIKNNACPYDDPAYFPLGWWTRGYGPFFHTPQAAKDALSACSLLWARSVAGLPPLEQQP